MLRGTRSAILWLFCMSSLVIVPIAAAQGSDLATAPIPRQILMAKTAFISNGGSASASVPEGQLYSAFYSAMKGWGKYTLLPAPADADLVFEISYSEPASDATNGTSFVKPELRLVILDPKTHIVLWTITEYTKANPGKNSEKAMGMLVEDLKKLGQTVASETAAPAPAKKPSSRIW